VALCAVAGFVPFACQDYAVILVSRLLFGVGIGCLNSLAVSLVGDFFEGQERAALMGIRSSMETLSTAVLSALVGALIAFGWRWAFAIYLVAVPILVAFVTLVPDRPASVGVADVETESDSGHAINAAVVGLAVFAGLTCMVANGFVIRVPSIIEGEGMGTAVQAGLVVSVTTISGTLAGFSYGSLHRLLGRHVITLACALMVAGTALCYRAGSVLALGLAGVLLDFAWPLIISHVMNVVPERSARGSATISTAFIVAATAVTSLLAPTALNVTGAILGTASLAAPFAVYAIMVAGLGVWWVARLG
jgi:MFS family permease